MTTEEAADRAWALMVSHAMPPAIAMDFVQERTDDRAKALEALLTAAVVWSANLRPTAGHAAPDFRLSAGRMAGEILACRFATAMDERARMARNAGLHQMRSVNVLEAGELEQWFNWLETMTRVIGLCSALYVAAQPPEKR